MALRNSLVTRLQGSGVVHKPLIVREATATTSPQQPPSLLMAWSPHIPSPPINSSHNIQLFENDLSYVLVVLARACVASCILSSEQDGPTSRNQIFLYKLKECVTVMSSNIVITTEFNCQFNPTRKTATILQDIMTCVKHFKHEIQS